MALIGKKVAPFEAQAYQGGEFKTITNDSFAGKWAVFVFYPADFTFVCPTELADLADHYEQFKAANCEVYSVSCDTEYVHKAWHDTSDSIKKIEYPMIADPTGKLAKDFQVYIEEAGLALRGSFVVDPNGEIKAYEVHDLGIGREAGELLRKLKAAQFVAEHGEVCPAKWQPGAETINPTIDLVGKI